MSAPANIPITSLAAGPLMWRLVVYRFRTHLTIAGTSTYGFTEVAALSLDGALAAIGYHIERHKQQSRSEGSDARLSLTSANPDQVRFIEVAAW